MCMQCLVFPYYFGEVIPRWCLIRARKDEYNAPKDAQLEMRAGDWGLLVCNDPSIIWSTMPKEYPDQDNTPDDELDKYDQEIRDFEDAIHCIRTDDLYKMVASCVELGFDPNGDLYFAEWFYDYLAKYIRTHEGVEDDDPELCPTNPIKLFSPLGEVIND